MKKYARELFFENVGNIIDQNRNNPKTYWEFMRMLLKSKVTTEIPPLLDIANNTYYYNDTDKADTLNKYSCSIFTVNDDEVKLPDFPQKTNVLSNIFIEKREIIDVIGILNVNKASGPDEISHRFLREVALQISTPLAIIFNSSISTGIYPQAWKLAHVIPVFKSKY